MAQLQSLNGEGGQSERASRAQQMFLVYMTTSVTIFPVSILGFRMAAGAAHPADVFLPLLIASYVGLFAGLAYMAVVQKIKLFDPLLLACPALFVALLGGLSYVVSSMSAASISPKVALLSNALLLGAVFVFLLLAWVRKVDVFDTFLDGAKKDFQMAVDLLPYVIGMFLLISLLRASGVFALLQTGLLWGCTWLGLDSSWVAGVPQGILKSFSGGGARALMLDSFKTHGVDSYFGYLSSIVQGASDTTFYILAACAGAAKLKNIGSAVAGSLVADAASFVAAVACARYFFA
jgi:spore maturation protein SpmB